MFFKQGTLVIMMKGFKKQKIKRKKHKHFNFKRFAKIYYKANVFKKTLKDAYNNGKKTPATNFSGIYALYFNDELMKIGKAIYGGVFTRFSQYYRMTKEGCEMINLKNRDRIIVRYFKLDKNNCWAAERKMQAKAYDCGARMPWEKKK